MIFNVYAFLLGTVLGSFYMLVATRIPIGKSIITPRSYCDHCQHTLQPKELVPILSFCIQKGCCKHCKRKIPFTYLLFEGMTGGSFFFFACLIGRDIELIFVWTVLSLLIIITMTDLLYMVIPNVILTFFACVLALERIFIPLIPWWDSLLGASIIFLVLYSVQMIYPNGLGGGDVKLLTLLGFVFGIQAIFLVLFFASCLGLVIFGFGMILRRMNARQALPFGPCIAFGAVCSLMMMYVK